MTVTRKEIRDYIARYVEEYFEEKLDDEQILARLHYYRKRWKEYE